MMFKFDLYCVLANSWYEHKEHKATFKTRDPRGGCVRHCYLVANTALSDPLFVQIILAEVPFYMVSTIKEV